MDKMNFSVNDKLRQPPKVAAVHDISCIGRCASTVIIPVMSVLGVEVCPLPTALLSTHTGGYAGFTFLDLSDEIEKIYRHWNSLGVAFDAVYSGFLGNERQIETVLEFAKSCKEKNGDCIFLADPVMGDDGRKYATYTDEMCRLMKKLVSSADIITPNLTEACILLDIPYRTDFCKGELERMLDGLLQIGAKNVIITGVHRGEKIGACYKSSDGEYGEYFAVRDEKNYPGTGDIFASIVLSHVLCGKDIACGVKAACDFISAVSKKTTSLGTPVREGLAIEGSLGLLL